MILIADIQRAVASEYKIPLAVMREPRRVGKTQTNTWPVSRPRQAAIYISSCLTQHSYVRIGQLFGGRDHSTVIHAIRVTKRRLAKDIAFQDAIRRIVRVALNA